MRALDSQSSVKLQPDMPCGDAVLQAFEDTYKREFGFVLEKRSIIVDDLRVRATGKVAYSISYNYSFTSHSELPCLHLYVSFCLFVCLVMPPYTCTLSHLSTLQHKLRQKHEKFLTVYFEVALIQPSHESDHAQTIVACHSIS